MANVPEEKLRAIKEKIFELEPYMMSALEGEMLPDHEVVIEWFDGEDTSVMLNVLTGVVKLGKMERIFFEEGDLDEDEE